MEEQYFCTCLLRNSFKHLHLLSCTYNLQFWNIRHKRNKIQQGKFLLVADWLWLILVAFCLIHKFVISQIGNGIIREHLFTCYWWSLSFIFGKHLLNFCIHSSFISFVEKSETLRQYWLTSNLWGVTPTQSV